MYATSSSERAGVLVAVISGGRPTLKQRLTGQFLDECRAAGVQDAVWIVNERHAGNYERDANPMITFSDDWAFEYSAAHWMNPDRPPEPGGFFGAFAGREAACREAERRGCWAVLQLDDNIIDRAWQRCSRGGRTTLEALGGYGFIVDILAGLALSTNAWMIGPLIGATQLSERRVIRRGFPYSSFLERVGPGREEWFGPFEDDITHALQYADRADGATAAVAPMLRYRKMSAGTKTKGQDLSGMRSQYGHDRSKMLQRLQPHSASVVIKSGTKNGRGQPRVFHQMPPNAIRNPPVVTDQRVFERVTDRFLEAAALYEVQNVAANRRKARERLEAHLAKGAAHAGGAA